MPLLYVILTSIFPPNYSGMIKYMYTKKLGVSVEDIAIVDNLAMIVYYFFFLWLINKLQGVPLWKLFIWGNIAGLASAIQISVFMDLPIWL